MLRVSAIVLFLCLKESSFSFSLVVVFFLFPIFIFYFTWPEMFSFASFYFYVLCLFVYLFIYYFSVLHRFPCWCLQSFSLLPSPIHFSLQCLSKSFISCPLLSPLSSVYQIFRVCLSSCTLTVSPFVILINLI